MSSPLVLTFDIGTQSARAMIFNKFGAIVEQEQARYEKPYYSKMPGWAEQRPDFYWETMCDMAQKLKARNPIAFDSIEAVTLTTFRGSNLCVGINGKPIRDLIVWLDSREAKVTKPLAPFIAVYAKLTNSTSTVNHFRSAAFCNWIMDNEPDIWENTYKFLYISTYLIYKLTGNFKDSYASTLGYMPLDYKGKKWMNDNDYRRFVCDVPKAKLCELVAPGESLGGVTHEAGKATGIKEGLPVIATGSDIGCSTIGLSCCTEDKIAISLGTTATIQFTSDKYVEPAQFVPGYPSLIDGKYSCEQQIYRGMWIVSWFKEQFGEKEQLEALEQNIIPEEVFNHKMTAIPPGSDGLILQPYFSRGVIRSFSRGAFVGIQDYHTRIHFYRAIIEGLLFTLLEGMEVMEKRIKKEFKEIYLGGGGAKSDEICQMAADMFGLPVHTVQTAETTGLGSSIMAFVALKQYPSVEAACEEMVHIKKKYIPNPQNHKTYNQIYHDSWLRISDIMEPIYKKKH